MFYSTQARGEQARLTGMEQDNQARASEVEREKQGQKSLSDFYDKMNDKSRIQDPMDLSNLSAKMAANPFISDSQRNAFNTESARFRQIADDGRKQKEQTASDKAEYEGSVLYAYQADPSNPSNWDAVEKVAKSNGVDTSKLSKDPADRMKFAKATEAGLLGNKDRATLNNKIQDHKDLMAKYAAQLAESIRHNKERESELAKGQNGEGGFYTGKNSGLRVGEAPSYPDQVIRMNNRGQAQVQEKDGEWTNINAPRDFTVPSSSVDQRKAGIEVRAEAPLRKFNEYAKPALAGIVDNKTGTIKASTTAVEDMSLVDAFAKANGLNPPKNFKDRKEFMKGLEGFIKGDASKLYNLLTPGGGGRLPNDLKKEMVQGLIEKSKAMNEEYNKTKSIAESPPAGSVEIANGHARPAAFTDAQWAAYKAATGAK